MSKSPSKNLWVTVIGLSESGLDSLSKASTAALTKADIIFGPPRHLALIGETKAEQIAWPVPFADGIKMLLEMRGKQVVVLASGDPFWFGAGTTLAKHLEPHEWCAFPGPSTFSLAASHMGWPHEHTPCYGLHAAPLSRLRPMLANGAKALVLLRDGNAVHALAAYLTEQGFGASELTVLEALGGPRETVSTHQANTLAVQTFQHPVCAAITITGDGASLPRASGRPDTWFDSDGQMTKRPVRALTLSALAPQFGEHLWDIGGGSGSISIEWLLSHSSLTATTIEPQESRAARIAENAARLGVDRLKVIHGSAPDVLADLAKPDVVFVGGGLSATMLEWLLSNLPKGTRLVANAVTLETEALLLTAQAKHGGDLLKAELSQVQPLGSKRGWKASFPIVQWSHTL
ncbi:precorrin-6y C5,15-methyltransferase (decarboxylating) subunit CbiE [Lentibacter algarum]|uniref:precorrin-6y C5,15-methyltransferase (decarboxylating) subunit CbiE n=1 Tax=Lentibacter algarum TaxID=576131 RepID=UPI001C07102B|nr:precorrin-6y C5,15-methyltransferase (decarboxylating) subunit CbiE [Lentibacter algarum]MBU2981651.1 precorrin-6y C5,15-methyltransferase (decarboxylating) subunit CbiE [Lentibacter algarum]